MAPYHCLGTNTYFKHFFNDRSFSNVTLRLGDRIVHVHRVVLSRHSAYFEKLFTSGFKVKAS